MVFYWMLLPISGVKDGVQRGYISVVSGILGPLISLLQMNYPPGTVENTQLSIQMIQRC